MDGQWFACQEDTAKGASADDSILCSAGVCGKSVKLRANEPQLCTWMSRKVTLGSAMLRTASVRP